MNIEELRDYCLSKKASEETFPFGEDHLVFKVGGKMFLLTSLNESLGMNVKCDPDWAVELREKYSEIIPGYHMNKKLWNTVDLTGSLSDRLIIDLIDHSYNLVVSGLSKNIHAEIKDLE